MLNLTDRGYFEELKDLGKKLQDFIAHFEKGEVSYYKDIAIKLRILYLFKSKAKPLLKTVSEIFGFKVKVFINYTISERIEKGLIPEDIGRGLLNSLAIEINNNTANWFTKGKDLIDIFDALDRKEIFIEGKHYSYKEIIEYAADKMGGAHIDKHHDETHIRMHSSDGFRIGGLPIAQRAIWDTGRESITLINYIIDFIENGKESTFVCDSLETIEDVQQFLDNTTGSPSFSRRGYLRAKHGDFAGAITEYTKAIELDSQDFAAYSNRGVLKYELEDFEGAREDFDDAIRLNPKYADAYNNRGILRFKQGDLKEAMADFDRAIELNPNHANAYFNKALLLEKMEMISEAIECCKEYIRLMPDDPRGPELLARLEKKLKR